MDLSQLEDMLEQDTYIPTFNKPSRNNTTKPLAKNNSNKSLEKDIPPSNLSVPTDKPRNNMFQIHKDSRKEVATFEQFFKQNNQPKRQLNPQPKIEVKDTGKTNKLTTNKNDELNINNLLDDDDQPPTVGVRKMKPPLSRKNEDGKSVASRLNDQNRSITSVAQHKKQVDVRQQQKISNAYSMAPSIGTNKLDYQKQKEQKSFPKQVIKQIKPISSGSDPQVIKIMNEQLQLQRQLNQKLLKQQQQAHRGEIHRLNLMHQQQLKKKLQLKDFEIEKLKQFYEMQLKARQEKANQIKQLSVVSQRVEEGIKAFQRAEQILKERTYKYEEERLISHNQSQSLQGFSKEKQKYIQEQFSKLELREREFREEKVRMINDLQRERKRMEENEAKLLKRERELEQKYAKKERALIQQYQSRNRKMNEEESRLRMENVKIQEERLKYQQEREEAQARQRKWEESRAKMMEQIQLQRTKLITRQVQLNSKLNEWEVKQSQMSLRERQLLGKIKLVQLQRRKWQGQRESKRKPGLSAAYTGFSYREGPREQTGIPTIEKSIKQLKDQYLRNLGQL